MFGIEANYYIAEVEYQEGEGEEEDEEEAPPQEQVTHCLIHALMITKL